MLVKQVSGKINEQVLISALRGFYREFCVKRLLIMKQPDWIAMLYLKQEVPLIVLVFQLKIWGFEGRKIVKVHGQVHPLRDWVIPFYLF